MHWKRCIITVNNVLFLSPLFPFHLHTECTMRLEDLLERLHRIFHKLCQTSLNGCAPREQKQMKNYGKFISRRKTSESHKLLCCIAICVWKSSLNAKIAHHVFIFVGACSQYPSLCTCTSAHHTDLVGENNGGTEKMWEKIKGCKLPARCVSLYNFAHKVINDSHCIVWKSRNRCIFIAASHLVPGPHHIIFDH